MSIIIKPLAMNRILSKYRNHSNQVYTITKYVTPYTIQSETNNILKSSVVIFSNKLHAARFAHLMEEYYQRNYTWPNINIDNTSTMLFSSKYNNTNENDLKTLLVDKWENQDLLLYCRDNILNIISFEENLENYDPYKKIFKLMYKVKLYNVETTIEKERKKCESMYNYL